MYGKIFESIYEGSLYGHYEAIVTFQALIVLADEDGIIDISPQALSGKTSIPLDVIRKGLKVLQQSDPHSRSSDEDGKRIVLLDEGREFGWQIVNYMYYRNMASRDDKRRADRERLKNKRKSLKTIIGRNVSQNVANVAHTDTDTDTYINLSAWQQYEAYRQERGASKLTKQGVTMAQNKLLKLSHDEQQTCVDLSISNGWTGLFPEKQKAPARKKLSYSEQLRADMDAKGMLDAPN